MDYFEVPIAAGPDGNALCSDNDCPCGYPGAKIPKGGGYVFISQTVVDFRKDAHSVREAQSKIAMLRAKTGSMLMFDQNVVAPTLMCEQGAKKRKLDLVIAAADAKHWWDTGMVPLRATPLAGSQEARRERERMGLSQQ
jgi:hypothetical protein